MVSESSKALRSYVTGYFPFLKFGTAVALVGILVVALSAEQPALFIFGPMAVLGQHYFQSAFIHAAIVLCDIADSK